LSRVRSKLDAVVPGGYIEKLGNKSYQGPVSMDRASCTDEKLPGDCYDLTVSKVKFTGGELNSDPGGYYSARARDNYIPQGVNLNWPQCWGLSVPYPGELPDAAYAAAAVARTNPSRPYVDVPVNILELGDITSLVRSQGNTLIKQLGGNNLRLQFGIMPLVGDLVKLTQFYQAAHRRIDEIKKLNGPRGLRRTISLDTLSVSEDKNEYLQTLDIPFRRQYTLTGHRQVKAHVRWKAAYALDKLNQREMSNLATRAVLGLTVDFATLWEAMPWSWMIDWGTNIGNYLKANRNIIPASLVGVWLTKYSTVSTKMGPVDWSYHHMNGLSVERTDITRRKVVVTPTAHFPFLSGNQMGILASLAVTRM